MSRVSSAGQMAERPVHFYKLMLEVSDLDRSETYYRDDMGLEFIGRGLWPGDPPNATFRCADGSYVELVQVNEVKPDGAGVHRNFMLPEEDYWVVFNRLKEKGWQRQNYRTEMGVRSATEVTCSVFDPDRHRLQLTAWRNEYHAPAAGRGKIAAGHIEDFPIGSMTHVREGGFFIWRTAEGMLALNQVCTHLQCTLAYQHEHYQFYCYCHGRRFQRNGEQVAIHPDVEPLNRYAIELVDGQVVVDTDTSVPCALEAINRMVPVPQPVA